MNIFQQVFASVNPRSAEILKERNPGACNRVSSCAQKPEPRALAKRPQQTMEQKKPEPVKEPVAKKPAVAQDKIIDKREVMKRKASVDVKKLMKSAIARQVPAGPMSPVKRKPSIAKAVKRNLQKKPEDVMSEEEDSFEEVDEVAQKRCEELEAQVAEMKSKLENAKGLLKSAKVTNTELTEGNAQMEAQLQRLEQGAKEANKQILAMKKNFEEKMLENEVSWEYRVTEMLAQIQTLKATN